MRRMILALAVLALLGAGYGLSVWRNAPPSADDLIAAMRQADPSLTRAEIALEDCRLTLRQTGPATGAEALLQSELDIDLSLFDTSTARVTAPEDGPHVLLLARRPVNTAMLDQAEKIVQALPGGALPGEDGQGVKLDRAQLQDILGKQGAVLRFHLSAQIIDAEGDTPARLKASAHAPAFYDFAEAVRNAPAPRSYAAVLTFAAQSTPGRDSLLAGLLTFPANLQFRAPDTETARALGETIFRYTAARCPMRPAEAG